MNALIRRRFWMLIVVIGLVFVGGIVAARTIGEDRVSNYVAPPAVQGTPPPIEVAVSPDEQKFYQYIGARMRALTAEADLLVKLGESRSRNVVELQIRRDRVTTLSDQIDGYLEQHQTPPRFEPAVTKYREGVVTLRTGMESSLSAFMTFDWDALAAGLDTFSQGATAIDRAYQLMRTVVDGTASPVAATILITSGARAAA